MYDNVTYLLVNKEAMDANLLILQEEKKDSELVVELKNQLNEKSKLLKEKNQNLLDLQRKYNEQEKKIFELYIQVVENKELESRLKEAEKGQWSSWKSHWSFEEAS